MRAGVFALSLAMGLAGCSTVRLGYDNGPWLAYWWLDSRLDFNAEQSAQVKAALSQWFAWHRQTQLEPYAVLLAAARAQATEAVSPEQMCLWSDRLRDQVEPALERLLPAVARIAPTLQAAQIDRLQARLAQDDERLRKQFLEGSEPERLQASIKRTVERFEGFYGRLSPAQRQMVAEHVRRHPFDARRWLEQRQWRQRELIEALRLAAAEPARGSEAALTQWQVVARRLLSPPQPDGPAQGQRTAAHNCELATRIHNAASDSQRQAAISKLKGWEQDARELARSAPAPVNTAAAR